jgi:hypothetical protein
MERTPSAVAERRPTWSERPSARIGPVLSVIGRTMFTLISNVV